MRTRATLLLAAMVLFGTTAAWAAQTMTFDWEDGVSTALGTYGPAVLANSTAQANAGTHSLMYTKSPSDGSTPQAYIWWVQGCVPGDTITASIYAYDVTPGATTGLRGRLWGHYTDATDVTSYTGSASGPSNYSTGIGWEQLTYTWVFASSGDDYGLVVETRVYTATGTDSTIYFDTAYVRTSSDVAVIHNAGGAIPVELASFVASATAKDVVLTWSTATEADNLGFNILRALGSAERSLISPEMVLGAGTTLQPQHYTFVDRDVSQGTTYRYWLEQVDFQGTTELYGPVSASVPISMTPTLALGVQPVPVVDEATISLSMAHEGAVRLAAYDLQGREVASIWQSHASAGTHVIPWQRGELPSGAYLLKASTDAGVVTHRVIVR